MMWSNKTHRKDIQIEALHIKRKMLTNSKKSCAEISTCFTFPEDSRVVKKDRRGYSFGIALDPSTKNNQFAL